MQKSSIKLGIGFATGRKNFRKVLNSYIYSWVESEMASKMDVRLSLFVAYDLDYSNTQSTDYTNLNQEMVDAFEEIVFLGEKNAQKDMARLIRADELTEEDAKLIFASGYAGKRNAILHAAMESHMDYLLFLDDDEYPVAVTNNRGDCLWGGQYVIPYHLNNIAEADITNGYHCGYISPIPFVDFNEVLTEEDFRGFIEALSNDIVNWESIRAIMQNGGVTYADTSVLVSKESREVPAVNGCKFITGANLCINLTRPERVFPFYNPPGARGEDTFLSSLLTDRVVRRIPCYAFHDGFGIYKHLLDGVLPLKLKSTAAGSDKIVNRFYNTCIGWIRYKPLLVYITAPEKYKETIKEMKQTLNAVVPKLCQYFDCADFAKIIPELEKYDKNVERHSRQFLQTREAWSKLMKHVGG